MKGAIANIFALMLAGFIISSAVFAIYYLFNCYLNLEWYVFSADEWMAYRGVTGSSVIIAGIAGLGKIIE